VTTGRAPDPAEGASEDPAEGADGVATGRSTDPAGDPPEDPAGNQAAGRFLVRFDRVERTLHWVNAGLFAILILTGAALSLTPLMALVGRRLLVEQIHLGAGLALPGPFALAVAGRWGRGLRRDLSRLNRWTEDDRRWFAALGRSWSVRRYLRADLLLGKFNPGQKLNAAFTAGGTLVMLASGCMLHWFSPFPLSWRAGATFVHNWLALVFFVVITAHVCLALADRQALGSMVRGTISRAWARVHAPAWLEEMDAERRSAMAARSAEE
jgi:formate dehydrogenase subunit gamma